MVVERDTVVGGVRLHWAEAGTGDPALVLLHGLNWSWSIWHDVIEPLSAERRVIMLDLPGHGDSDSPEASYRPEWLAGGVRALLAAAGVDRAIVAGNSLGGLVACVLAAAEPGRVAALAALAPALPNDAPSDRAAMTGYLVAVLPVVGPLAIERWWGRDPDTVTDERLARNLVDPTRVSPELRRLIVQETARRARSRPMLRAGLRATRQLVWAMSARRERTWSMLRSITVPTAFIWGEGDRQVPIAVAERAVQEVPGSHLIVLDDCGHTPQAEHPEQLASALNAFARAVEARA